MPRKLIGAVCSALALLLAAGVALAAPCDVRSSAPFIEHDPAGYCELCGYGYVTIVITNRYEGADMTDMTIVEDLRNSGLTFDPSAPNPVRFNGSSVSSAYWPGISGSNDQILTWTPSRTPPSLRNLESRWPVVFNTLTVTFAVTRAAGFSQEGLVGADRNIRAQLTYRAEYETFPPTSPPTYVTCPGTPRTETTGLDELALREPDPEVSKRGRNVDADQDSWSQTVYGNVNDDVIWRIRVRNEGDADLQDLRFDDLMPSGNLDINYICPTATAAANAANNNGVDPGGGGCLTAGNSINNFDVDNPFGNPGNDWPDIVDARQGQSTYIYLVGKIPASPNGSCSSSRTNTVSDVQWGCEGEGPAGGIAATSTGSTPGSATATLSTLSDNDLNFNIRITGVSASQPAGSKGRARITITNATGGTVKNIKLHNVLPAQYVMDPTFTPRVAMDSAYGAYAGMTDNITWDNPVAGTFPNQTSNAPNDYLNNTQPRFTLTSSGCSVGECGPTRHPIYADQVNMLRHGDRLEVTFGVILIRPESYDKVADLDVRTEAPPGTDPDNDITLSNRLNVTFEDFCSPGTIVNRSFNTTHPSNPEDLDINIIGDPLVFILTNDPGQRLPLTVRLTNNGGHSADDYVAYVSFGQTMDVVTAPGGCTLTGNPGLAVWQEPAPVPASAAVYACTGSPIGPGGRVDLDFEVIKSTNPGDITADDLSFRADVIGEITLSNTDTQGRTQLWFPTPVNPRADNGTDAYNNYSLDGIRARVVGFNLLKSQVGTCSENNPPPTSPDLQVQIGEECTYHFETGGWFGFKTPGFNIIAVQDIQVVDQLPDGQGYISSTDPYLTSTSAIRNISLNPAGLSPVDEGYIDWTFNRNEPAERITTIDEWFRVNMVSRLLNDPIDTSAAPNRHAAPSTDVLVSEFDAVFQTAPGDPEEVYRLGPSTVGYPRVEVRRISLTVTEPDITVVKEVCNESLYGTGPTCSNWVPLADDGDAYNDYLYRLTLTNEASSSGVDRAPAYDVIVTDRLDASDLAYVRPFASDGLDNDGDGVIDEAGEGTISDNIVKNGTPAVLTFAYTHSSALERINAGASVELYYRVDFDNDAAPLQTFTNTADTTYDSLAGASGNQTVDPRPNSDIGGARVYTSPPDSAVVQIIPVETQPKRIAALSNTPLAGGAGTQAVSIGEEIEYRLNTLLPVALLRSFVIRDELPAGLRCSQAPVVNLDAPPYAAAGFLPGGSITPTCTDTYVEWNFGDQRVTNGTVGSRYDLEIGFIARVENTAGTNDGDVLSNGDPATNATARYIDEGNNTVVQNFDQVDVLVREPRIDLAKTFAVANADAADVLTVTVTAANSGTATAYNLRVLDDLTGRNLTFAGNVGGSDPPDNIDTTTLGANRPIFSWNRPNGIDPGSTISFTFQIRVDDVVQPHEVLENTIQADWTSLPGQNTALNSTGAIGADGSQTGMRNGALPNAGDAVNDYETTATDDVTVPPVTLAKTDLDPAVVPAIGVHKTFQLDIRLPEGITNGVLVTDSLDAAGVSYLLENNAGLDITYTFEGIAAINGAAPGEAAFNTFPADGTTGSAVWDIGTVVTRAENDPTLNAVNPLIRIHYFARVNNDLVTDAGDALQNSVVANYINGASGAQESLADDTAPVTVVEPVLAVTKTMSNITSPGDPAGGGDVLEYELVALNTGTSSAHDVNLVDTLPPQLSLDTGFIPTAMINGVPAGGFVAAPANAPGGPLVWGRENGDGSLDIPVGQSLVLTYRVVVQEVGGDLRNSVWTDWTSLDGASGLERTGDGCPGWTAPNDYCVGPAVAVTPTVDDNSILKTISADTYDVPGLSTAVDAVARVGDTITYRLALNLRGGLTRNVQVQDILPAGMAFVDVVRINGDTAAPYTPPGSGAGSNFAYASITAANIPAAGQTGTLTWTIGDVINDPSGNPATDTLEIIYRALIQPDAGIAHVATATLTNTATLVYAGAPAGDPRLSSDATVTLHQPIIAAATKTDRGGRTSPADVNVATDVMQFRLEACNSGQAPAYSIEVTDQLASQLNETGIVNLTVSVGGATLTAGSDYVYTPPAARGGSMHFLLNAPVNPGQCLTIDYDIGFYTDFGPNQTWNNSATVDRYWSLPARSGQEYGPVGPATFTMTNSVANTDPAKTIASPASAEAAIGDLIVYRITVPATPVNAALHDVRILDDLSASAADLSFVSVAKISGSQPWTPVNTGTAANLVIEDTTIGIDIPAGEQIVIEITVRLEDTSTNVSGLVFSNTAAYTYNLTNDDPGTQTDGGSDTSGDITIVGPDVLTLEKTGPATMQVGTPATFTLNVHNDSAGAAWNPAIIDRLPNGATGGTCGAGPTNVTAQIFESDGVTPVSPVLVPDTDFTVIFNGAPACEGTFQLLSAAGSLGPDRRLIINYDVELDPTTENGTTLTNIAGVTQWFSGDPGAAGASPRTYTRTVTDGTAGTLDHEDAHDVTAEAPVLDFIKRVRNTTTGQDPGADASPGDTLRYIIEVSNTGPVGLTSFSIVDDVDRLNAPPVFAAGSLNLISVPAGADTSGTDPLGGTNGTGLVSVANLSVDPGATVVVAFEITLAPVITSGTLVLNQAELVSASPAPLLSDDPNVAGDTDPTETRITSAPRFQVQKISTDLTDDPAILMAGDTLRYTITIKNIGDEDAVNVRLRDFTPANTTYVASSTTLNGIAVPDPSPGVSPLQTGIPINAPENTTPGYMRADTAPTADNLATVTFDVVVDPSAMDGLVIENQGFVSSAGAGSGSQPEQPSDDPDTPIPDDPTRDVVGNRPLLYAHKTVALFVDNGSPGIVDPGDSLRYTIVISNYSAIPATGVVLTDTVPNDTTYVASSTTLNGVAVPDGGGPPLTAGLPVQSDDNPGAGIVSAGRSAVVTFDVRVNNLVPAGTEISNQGDLTSNELPPGLTDADGLPANGYQPTVIKVGDPQLLTITKQVAVVGGGPALAGGQLEYVIRVTNYTSLPATQAYVTDDLNPPLGNQVSYVAGSATLNGAAAGVAFTGGILTADYAGTYGPLAPGGSFEVRFRVLIDAGLDIGTTITNTGVVHWNSPEQTASASVSIDVGGTPGSAVFNGIAWHDANLDTELDSGETRLAGWSAILYRNGAAVATVLTDAAGAYRFGGLLPNQDTPDQYEIRFRARGAGPNAAALGYAHSPFTDGPHRISDIMAASGANLQDLNLPITPNGAVYDSVARTPVSGARLSMQNAVTGAPVSSLCFDDPNQQGQVTAQEGFYKFDLNFSDGSCPAGGAYLIDVTSPATGYMATPSRIIPPTSDASTAPFSVPACPGSPNDAVPATPGYCEVVVYPAIPPVSVPPRTPGTEYHLQLLLSDGTVPGQSQIFNNPIPIDPQMDEAVAISKTSSEINVTRGTLVPYTITVNNVFGVPLYDIRIVDRFPAGFKYVADSARLNGAPVEPQISGRELVWDGLELDVNATVTIKLLLVVGSGVSEGDYVNRALVFNDAIDTPVSGEATATVRVTPDPDLDCTDVIGKVFDDRNLNGRQDKGEKGLAGVRIVTARGLIATTDPHGRFHITCAAVPDEDRGSNLILKLDDRSLPTGYRLTTENPRVQRATRGKMIRFNFGATIHRVVRIDIADGVFEPGTSELRLQWAPKIAQLLEELQKAPSVLRLSYLADVESPNLVRKRLDDMHKLIARQWEQSDGGYPLTIETEVFWRRGAPVAGR